MINPKFLPHNSHLENPALFEDRDPQLRWLKQQKYIHRSSLLEEFPTQTAGIYTLGGGRQIGKSTLLKQWMLKLLEENVLPNNIIFISGELISDHHALLDIVTQVINDMPSNQLHYVICDEITYIKEWDKGIKFAADAGILENTILMLTGSDLSLMQEARMRFPGRRGKADTVNFHLHPLSFREVVQLKYPGLHKDPEQELELLFDEFERYLQHGGFLTAINELAMHNTLSNSTLNTYSEWIRGDMLKRGKQEHYLKEIVAAIIKRYNSQVSWNALSKDLSIDHPKTVSDYVTQLESMDTVFIQGALLEDKLTMAPKKGKKLIFNDPFIFHALQAWITPDKNPYESQIKTILQDPKKCSLLVEACVTAHYKRFYPTYYIKAEGEVDIAYLDKNRFWPVEIKWTNQIRPHDLKQILKYPNGRIFSKIKSSTTIG